MNYNNISEAHAWLIATMDDLKQFRAKKWFWQQSFIFICIVFFLHAYAVLVLVVAAEIKN